MSDLQLLYHALENDEFEFPTEVWAIILTHLAKQMYGRSLTLLDQYDLQQRAENMLPNLPTNMQRLVQSAKESILKVVHLEIGNLLQHPAGNNTNIPARFVVQPWFRKMRHLNIRLTMPSLLIVGVHTRPMRICGIRQRAPSINHILPNLETFLVTVQLPYTAVQTWDVYAAALDVATGVCPRDELLALVEAMSNAPVPEKWFCLATTTGPFTTRYLPSDWVAHSDNLLVQAFSNVNLAIEVKDGLSAVDGVRHIPTWPAHNPTHFAY